ncbi:MAG: cbb3-type cytochrome c oxidase subunit II, partial [Saprospiraceae bacterium]|nr:cbb3-type cytochrome c oxidase subunit II [Saprospiraceae bacterium]
PGSIMPSYPWLFKNEIDLNKTESMIWAMRKVGVPYEKGYEKIANADLKKQNDEILKALKADKIEAKANTEIIALIAYLQRLGTDIKGEAKTAAATN